MIPWTAAVMCVLAWSIIGAGLYGLMKLCEKKRWYNGGELWRELFESWTTPFPLCVLCALLVWAGLTAMGFR